MISTAIYSNRVEDRQDIQAKFPALVEFGSAAVRFIKSGILVAQGYERVVYGDHGPYVEFSRSHFKVQLVQRFGSAAPKLLPSVESAKFYYYWLKVNAAPEIKIYWQIKPVTDLPTAPRREDGKPSKFYRAEGYADYRRGFYYVSPLDFDVIEVGLNDLW